MPGELTPAPAGQAADPVAALLSVSNVHSAMGTLTLASVTQSIRQYVYAPLTPTPARKMSAPLLSARPDGYT
jgi:hypothetical protein